jgi:hypothetical protein
VLRRAEEGKSEVVEEERAGGKDEDECEWRNSEVGARFYTLTKLTESSVPGC